MEFSDALRTLGLIRARGLSVELAEGKVRVRPAALLDDARRELIRRDREALAVVLDNEARRPEIEGWIRPLLANGPVPAADVVAAALEWEKENSTTGRLVDLFNLQILHGFPLFIEVQDDLPRYALPLEEWRWGPALLPEGHPDLDRDEPANLLATEPPPEIPAGWTLDDWHDWLRAGGDPRPSMAPRIGAVA